MPDSDLNSLVKVPSAVVEHLKDEPVLLGGMGAGSLVVIIAVFAPGAAQVYGWIIGGLMLVLCLGKLIFDARTRDTRLPREADQDVPELRGGLAEIRTGKHLRLKNSRVRGEQTSIVSKGRATVKGATIEAGTWGARDGENRPGR